MRLRILAAFSMTFGILAAMIGLAGPASAAPPSWVMPDVQKMVLRVAVKEVQEVTGSAEYSECATPCPQQGLNFRFLDTRSGQDVHNLATWMVCYQSPLPGKGISQKTKRVVLYVKRFNQQSCWS